jgi:hypothetical protein
LKNGLDAGQIKRLILSHDKHLAVARYKKVLKYLIGKQKSRAVARPALVPAV